MVAELQALIDKVWRHCDDKGARGPTVTLKMKFSDFEIITRRRSVPVAVSPCSRTRYPSPGRSGFWGVSLSSLQGEDEQEPQLGFPI